MTPRRCAKRAARRIWTTMSIAAAGSSGPLLAHDRLQRAAGDVLHRDVVGAVPLAAVEDADDVRVRQRGGARGLAPEALDELLVFGEVVVQDLDGDLAAEQLVLGEVDVGHAARAEPRDHAVAPVDDRLGLNHGAAFRSPGGRPARRRRRPGRARPCSVTAIATRGSGAGAKAMNQTLLIAVADLRLGGPGLARHLHARDLRGGAGAFVDDRFHHRRHGGGGRAVSSRPTARAGAIRLHGAPFGVDDAARSGAGPSACRRWRRRPRPRPSAAA